jgi:diaminopimelate decarboxylase
MTNTLNKLLDQRANSLASPWCAYVYDLPALALHARHLKQHLPGNCELYYAAKANPDVRLLQTLAPHVDGFEAASAGELTHLNTQQFGKPLIFGGPGKTNEDLQQALQQRVACIHVESLTELKRLALLCAKTGQTQAIMLRMNISLEGIAGSKLQMGGQATPFGLDPCDLDAALSLLQGSPQLEFEGFHFHSMSHQLNVENHLKLIARYFEITRQWESIWRIRCKVINVGGGIGVNYQQVDEQFNWPAFCAGLGQLIKQHDLQTRRIRFECGRYVTAFCGYYIMEVIDLKQSHGQWFAIGKGGTHHFRTPAAQNHNHPVWVRRNGQAALVSNSNVNVVGQLCTPKDRLHQQLPVHELALGDYMVFTLAGAYSWNISHQNFLMHAPPEVVYLDELI